MQRIDYDFQNMPYLLSINKTTIHLQPNFNPLISKMTPFLYNKIKEIQRDDSSSDESFVQNKSTVSNKPSKLPFPQGDD